MGKQELCTLLEPYLLTILSFILVLSVRMHRLEGVLSKSCPKIFYKVVLVHVYVNATRKPGHLHTFEQFLQQQ